MFVPKASAIAALHGQQEVEGRDPIVNNLNGVRRLDLNVDGSPSFRDSLEQLGTMGHTAPHLVSFPC